MAKIVNLYIRNFRGIRELSLNFKRDQDLICLIGRGDSGKTTVLEAISSVLSPSWNLNFSDTDFYNCDYTNEIEIVASLVDFPERLLSDSKYGLHIRAFNTLNEEIIDDVALEEIGGSCIPLLTIKLKVGSSLEPSWSIVNSRSQEVKLITAADRALINCFLISDYIDRHFSWNKGTPLYSLLKNNESNEVIDNSNTIIQNLRNAKKEIDKSKFENLDKSTELIKSRAAELGLDLSKTRTTLDARELSIKDGKISLHEGYVPFRQKGKGSKRLASIAIQSVLVKDGGLMLIDEIEQGLEPDRIKQAVRALNGHHAGQIFITTHSRDAITELGSKSLLFFIKDNNNDEVKARSLNVENEDLQKAVRACPEAFFAKKVIVCEGATEVGLCRAMDRWRGKEGKPQMALMDCAYIDGTGSTLAQRVNEINELGISTSLLCDSDVLKINDLKSGWSEKGVSIFDCENDFSIERQLFNDLPWSVINKLLDYVLMTHKHNDVNALESSVSSKYFEGKKLPDDWRGTDSPEIRVAIADASVIKGKEWFKAIHHGEELGGILFDDFNTIPVGSRTKEMFDSLSSWIDADIS
jgi:putative ATP-dependent endonuclease of OLD family